jgi:alkanesulfonate monooxygenase SsuD/methylene tetrahydromethanopterin reductase-like flavin-dependent oxidoreductase (luciferase family)
MLGLGIGWNADEFAQLGVQFRPVPERQRGLEEALQIIDGMFGPEPVTFTGESWQVVNAHITSPPVQRPRPPILVAGAGEKTLRQVIRWADIANFGASKNTGNVSSDEATRQKLELIDRLCDEADRDPATLLKSHFTSWLMLEETDKAAKAKLDRYYPNGLTEEQHRTRIFGSPDTVIAYFRGLADLGFRYFVVQIQDSRDLETIRLLGEAVASTFA